jgi:DNA-binding response OmpR family regulator
VTNDILIVEDDADLAEVMESVLVSAGYEVRTAGDGIEALAKVDADVPALILLDMCLPRMDGWEFARVLRQRVTAPVPIVVVTAAEHARQRGAEIGASDTLAKPFSLDALRSVVMKYARSNGTAGTPRAGIGAPKISGST